jgi:universal stress protein A
MCTFAPKPAQKITNIREVDRMGEYSHILVAVDLTEEARHVSKRACALRTAFSAKLSCAHVIEPLSLAYGGDIPMDLSTIQEQIQETARSHLADFAKTLSIEPDDQHLVFGRPETELHTLADQIGADLIVVGSHGRHGLALLLGSTANGVLHGAPCDVLAVRVGS